MLAFVILSLAQTVESRSVDRLGEIEILSMTNQFRKEHSKPPLKLNLELSKAAQDHAKNMARQGKMAHVLDDKQPHERASDAGYEWRSIGENCATCKGYPDAKVPAAHIQSWIKSPGHNKNMQGDWAEIGVGLAQAPDGTWYACQLFGMPKKGK